MPEDQTPEREPFSTEEIRVILETCGKIPHGIEWQGVCLVSLYGGLRFQDCANLTHGEVDLQAGIIRYRPDNQRKTLKRKKEIVLPMHLRLRAFFEAYPSADKPEEPLFTFLAGRSSGSRGGLSDRFGKMLDQAGIDRGGEKPGARTVNRKSFHCFRHTCATMMANAGISEELRQAIVGHADKLIHWHYSHYEVETLRAAVAVIPEV